MRLYHALLLLPLFISPAFAEPAPGNHARRGTEQHFTDANTTRDGKLTLEQAKTGFKSIARSFPQIDVAHHGYVTLDDIKAWKAAKKAARQARQNGTAPPAPRTRAMAPMDEPGVPTHVDAPRIGVDVPVIPLIRARAS